MLSAFCLTCGCSNRNDNGKLRYKPNEFVNERSNERIRILEEHNITYYSGPDAQAHQRFDIYRPDQPESRPKPLIVMLHPGFFVIGSKNDAITTQLSRDFCREGYNVAAVDYRLINTREDIASSIVSVRYTRTKIMEAVDDARKAIVYLKNHGADYNIDTSNVFVVGYSAGAVIANHLLFSNFEEEERYIHERDSRIANNPFDPAIPITLREEPTLKGVIALSGGLMAQHANDMDLDNTPLLMINGNRDEIIPLGIGKPFSTANELGKISLPVFASRLGVVFNGQEHNVSLSAKINLELPISQAVSLFTSPMYGSNEIYHHLTRTPNLQYEEIEGAPHNFMTNEQGRFNQTYVDVKRKMLRFIQAKVGSLNRIQPQTSTETRTRRTDAQTSVNPAIERPAERNQDRTRDKGRSNDNRSSGYSSLLWLIGILVVVGIGLGIYAKLD